MLKIEGENSAFLSLTVLGWIRIPPKAGIHGSRSTIKIITHPGHILVDGSTLEFEDLVGEVFVEAGFALDGSARYTQPVALSQLPRPSVSSSITRWWGRRLLWRRAYLPWRTAPPGTPPSHSCPVVHHASSRVVAISVSSMMTLLLL